MTTLSRVASAKSTKSPRGSRRLRLIARFVLASAAAFVFAYPIIWLLFTSLKENVEIYRSPLRLVPAAAQFDTYVRVFQSTPVLRYLANSVVYACGGAAITLLFSVLVAYGFSRFRFRHKRLLLTLLLAVQLVPALVRIIPVYIMMTNLRLIDTWYGLVLLYGAGGIAYGTWFMKGFIDAVPRELDEAAWIDGASRWRALWQIVAPTLLPGLATLFILQFIGHWNDYATASVLLRSPDLLPLTVGTFRLIGPDESDFRLLASAALINIVPVMVIFSFVQRFLVAGSAAGAVK